MTPADVADRARRFLSILPDETLFAEIDKAASDELLSPAEYLNRLIAGIVAKAGRLPNLKDLA